MALVSLRGVIRNSEGARESLLYLPAMGGRLSCRTAQAQSSRWRDLRKFSVGVIFGRDRGNQSHWLLWKGYPGASHHLGGPGRGATRRSTAMDGYGWPVWGGEAEAVGRVLACFSFYKRCGNMGFSKDAATALM
jgi:hypothetical protein